MASLTETRRESLFSAHFRYQALSPIGITIASHFFDQTGNHIPVTLSAVDKYKTEYAEVGNLRRHYSTIRSALTTFSLTVSFAAFSNQLSQPEKPPFLVFVGLFMLSAAFLACLVFSYRSEKAELYLRDVWLWFGTEIAESPPRFRDYKPNTQEIIRGMRRDEMNWVVLLAVVLTVAAFYYLR